MCGRGGGIARQTILGCYLLSPDNIVRELKALLIMCLIGAAAAAAPAVAAVQHSMCLLWQTLCYVQTTLCTTCSTPGRLLCFGCLLMLRMFCGCVSRYSPLQALTSCRRGGSSIRLTHFGGATLIRGHGMQTVLLPLMHGMLALPYYNCCSTPTPGCWRPRSHDIAAGCFN